MGNQYLNHLALLAAISLITLLLNGFGYKTGFLAFSLILIMSIYAVLAFVKLGLRVFYFFNPGILTEELNYEIQKIILMATFENYRLQDVSFQNHCRKVVDDRILTYKNVIEYVISNHKRYSGKDIKILLEGLQNLYGMYCINKYRISPKSRWFSRVYKHKDWLLTEFGEISVAINTGTQLLPTEELDRNWLEVQITPMIRQLLKQLLVSNYWMEALSWMNLMVKWVQRICAYYAVLESSILMEAVQSTVEETFKGSYFDQKSTLELPGMKYRLAIIDTLSLMRIGPILGAARSIENIDDRYIKECAVKTPLTSSRQRSLRALPKEAIEMLDYLSVGIQNELSIESGRKTPDWYLEQLIGLAIVRFIDSFTHTYFSDIDNYYKGFTARMNEADQPILAMQCILSLSYSSLS